MRRVIPAVIALALVIGTGLVHGFFTERWHVNESIARAKESLKRMPTKIGDWDGEPVKGGSMGRLNLAGEQYVRFTNRKTGDVVTVSLVCGRMGPVSIHTPDVCYGASGYTVVKKSTYEMKELDGAPTFYTADMRPPTTAKSGPERLFWTWRAAGRWQVAENPRKTFTKEPVLYKFYLARELNSPAQLDQDPIVELLRQMLPELDRILDEA